MKHNKFTLIEMVVVCAILLFLMAGLFALGNTLFKKYYLMQGKMEFLKIQNAITAYKSATGNYPPDYISSSHNEDNSGGSIGHWVVKYMNAQWEGYKEAKDFYDKCKKPLGCPKALVQYNSGYGVWVYSWGADIGGNIPLSLESGAVAGYICGGGSPATCGKELCSMDSNGGDFGSDFPPLLSGWPGPTFVTVVEGDATDCYKCKYGRKGSLANQGNAVKCSETSDINDKSGKMIIVGGKILKNECDYKGKFVCGNPNDPKFSCGWHSFDSEVWEGAYNVEETSKALYDYLCRPMKGRMKDGRPTNPKFENCKPFIEFSNKTVRATGKPPVQEDICGVLTPILDTPVNYKKWGDGVYNLNDSFEIIDVWGNPYMYYSSAKEYVTPSFNNLVKPYQSYWVSDSSLGAVDSFNIDLRPPYYNSGSYDLGSMGPDGKAVNWIPLDFKLSSPSRYEVGEDGDADEVYIYGQKDSSGKEQHYAKLPSDALKQLDYDNDNITNFFENSN